MIRVVQPDGDEMAGAVNRRAEARRTFDSGQACRIDLLQPFQAPAFISSGIQVGDVG